MMLATRVIPCLDVQHGRVVKGVNFKNLADIGDPVELAARYAREGADELTFLDVAASVDDAETLYDVVERCAEQVFIPLTVGGGVRSADDVRTLLSRGADKCSVNSAAVKRPELISDIADRFGSQVLVLSLDVAGGAETDSGWEVTVRGGRERTGIDALEWAERCASLGAGEILLNSIDADGTREGFDIPLTRAVRDRVSIPVIASGGAGSAADFAPAVTEGGADAMLAASIFHSGQVSIAEVKTALAAAGVEVRR
ncbi:imidazole glycerol phosphate synthase subunit HisF [Agrococcus casei]|uniref:imidazole glycerol phosphate synthase subunit HisF n=1 Tax=Agrococcus casei TaxID=343512 RepID=UPI003F8F1BA2